MNIYLDCNATHPLLPAVREGLARAMGAEANFLLNPSSIHRAGQEAKKFVAEFRQFFCEQYLGRSDPDEIIFLSGATEALNLAMRAFAADKKSSNQEFILMASAVEHSAVLDTMKDLQSQALTLPVDPEGKLIASELFLAVEKAVAADQDVLLAVQAVNNETGLSLGLEEILPELYKLYGPRESLSPAQARRWKDGEKQRQRLWILVDAAQALGKMPEAQIRSLLHFADYMAFSAHKMGGPSGCGLLWIRPKAPFRAQMTGGSQEKKRRAGTFNSLGAYGFYLALKDWQEHGKLYRERLLALRNYVFEELQKIPGLHFHGKPELCNTLNFHVEGCPEESLLLALDLEGLFVSSGSACHSGSLRASHVLQAMGYADEVAYSSLRLCLGVHNTQADAQRFVEVLTQKVGQIRRARLKAQELLPELR